MSALKRLYPAEAAKLDGLLDVVREHMRRSGFQVTTGIEEFQPIPRHSDWHFGQATLVTEATLVTRQL